MVSPLPKWLMRNYAHLWKRFGYTEFKKERASETFAGGQRMAGVILSELRKAGWLTTRLDEEDARKRWYRLKDPASAVRGIGDEKVD